MKRAPSGEARLGDTGKPSVAVLYFENNTGSTQLDWLRTGLTDMLVTDLSQSPDVEVLGTDRLVQILTDMKRQDDKVDLVRHRAGTGPARRRQDRRPRQLHEVGRHDPHQHDAAGGRERKIVTSERVEAIGDNNLFPMVDDLTKRIKAKFALPGAAIRRGPAQVADGDHDVHRHDHSIAT